MYLVGLHIYYEGNLLNNKAILTFLEVTYFLSYEHIKEMQEKCQMIISLTFDQVKCNFSLTATARTHIVN